MSFDGFFLHHMTAELREQVLYGRIQKVNQPFERELVLTIRNNRQNYKLLLSAHPVFGRIQTTKADLPNPQNPNTYTMIMRKYLQGAVIEDIQQLENDRVLEISVSNKNEIGDSVKVTLVMEIMGKLGEKMPNRLALEEQGQFDLGYYHQMQKKYEKREEK